MNWLLDLSGDLPVVVVIMDEVARIPAFLPDAAQVWQAGLVLVEDVTAVTSPGGIRPA